MGESRQLGLVHGALVAGPHLVERHGRHPAGVDRHRLSVDTERVILAESLTRRRRPDRRRPGGFAHCHYPGQSQQYRHGPPSNRCVPQHNRIEYPRLNSVPQCRKTTHGFASAAIAQSKSGPNASLLLRLGRVKARRAPALQPNAARRRLAGWMIQKRICPRGSGLFGSSYLVTSSLALGFLLYIVAGKECYSALRPVRSALVCLTAPA